jgi:hypothetical protein
MATSGRRRDDGAGMIECPVCRRELNFRRATLSVTIIQPSLIPENLPIRETVYVCSRTCRTKLIQAVPSPSEAVS